MGKTNYLNIARSKFANKIGKPGRLADGRGSREDVTPIVYEEGTDTNASGNETRGFLGTKAASQRQDGIPIVYEEGIDINAYGNETRGLLGTRAAFQRPWHRDKRCWIRWPAQVWQATGQHFLPQVRLFDVISPSLLPFFGNGAMVREGGRFACPTLPDRHGL